MEITAVGIVMSDTDSAAHDHVNGYVLHGFRIQSSLELRRHEAITVAWVDKAEEVNAKQSRVEGDGNDDKAEEAGKEVLEPQTLSKNVSKVLQKYRL